MVYPRGVVDGKPFGAQVLDTPGVELKLHRALEKLDEFLSHRIEVMDGCVVETRGVSDLLHRFGLKHRAHEVVTADTGR